MRVSRQRFADLIKEAFSSQPNSANNKLRKDRNSLKAKRDQLYKKYIMPLDEGIELIDSKLNSFCEHPTKLVDVKIEGWHTDDGEGNDWSGDVVKITCKSCGLKIDVKSNSDGSHGDRYERHLDQVGRANLNKLWKQACDEQHKKDQESYRKFEEDQERKQYERLKQKYG